MIRALLKRYRILCDVKPCKAVAVGYSCGFGPLPDRDWKHEALFCQLIEGHAGKHCHGPASWSGGELPEGYKLSDDGEYLLFSWDRVKWPSQVT